MQLNQLQTTPGEVVFIRIFPSLQDQHSLKKEEEKIAVSQLLKLVDDFIPNSNY